LSLASDYGLNMGSHDLLNLEAWQNHLRVLTSDKGHSLLHILTMQTMARYLDYLNPRRQIKPSPTFNAYTRSGLIRYLGIHARPPKKPSMLLRMSLTYTVLIAALLVTGTAKAQSALPGDPLYGWKRTSEQAWLSVSPDPVGTTIILADRRLNEFIAVENDPLRRDIASKDYLTALTELDSMSSPGVSARIAPVLKAHKQRLDTSGLSTVQLDHYLTVAATPVPAAASTQVAPAEVAKPTTGAPVESALPATEVPPVIALPATSVPTVAAPPPTAVPTAIPTEHPTQVPPPPTEVPTEVASPPTEVPTEVASPPTAIPTQAAPPATAVPTQAAPPATAVPTQAAPPATAAPTKAAPPATAAPTEVPQALPTGSIP
jgi:hypothetical protein